MRPLRVRLLVAASDATSLAACGSDESESSNGGGQAKDGADRDRRPAREEKVLGSSTKRGEFPATLASATIENPAAIRVRVTPTPAARVTVSWNVACQRGRSAGNRSGRFTVRRTATKRLRAPLRRSEVCQVSASGQMYRRGTLKVQVIG